MNWVEGLARALIALLAVFALFLALVPHGSYLIDRERASVPAPARVVPCLAPGRVPAFCDPHR